MKYSRNTRVRVEFVAKWFMFWLYVMCTPMRIQEGARRHKRTRCALCFCVWRRDTPCRQQTTIMQLNWNFGENIFHPFANKRWSNNWRDMCVCCTQTCVSLDLSNLCDTAQLSLSPADTQCVRELARASIHISHTSISQTHKPCCWCLP